MRPIPPPPLPLPLILISLLLYSPHCFPPDFQPI